MGWQSHPRLQQLLARNFKKGSSEKPQDNTLKINISISYILIFHKPNIFSKI